MRTVSLLAAMSLIAITACAQIDPTVEPDQRTTISLPKNMNLQIGFNPMLAYTDVVNKNQAQDKTITHSGSVQVHYGFDGALFFNKYIGIGSGIYYASYGDSWTWNLPYTIYDLTDYNGNTFNATYSGSEAIKRKATYLEVPFVLRIKDNTFTKVGFYINPGIVVSLLASAQTDASGAVTLTDAYTSGSTISYPDYGVPSSNTSKSGLTKILLLTTISCGISIPLSDNFKANIGANYEKSITDMAAHTMRQGYFQFDGVYKSYTPSKLYSVGLEVSLNYKFR